MAAAMDALLFSPNGMQETRMSELLSWDAVVNYGDGKWLRESSLESISLDFLPLARSIYIWSGDITKLSGDSLGIVNAANWSLKSGGGICGVIHRAAGPELEEACFAAHPNGLTTTECAVTAAFSLPCSAVIHAVTPLHEEEDKLLATYHNALAAAKEAGLQAICFPALSTRSRPPSLAHARTELRAVSEYLSENDGMQVVFCCFSPEELQHTRAAMIEHFHRPIVVDALRRLSSMEELEARAAALDDA